MIYAALVVISHFISENVLLVTDLCSLPHCWPLQLVAGHVLSQSRCDALLTVIFQSITLLSQFDLIYFFDCIWEYVHTWVICRLCWLCFMLDILFSFGWMQQYTILSFFLLPLQKCSIIVYGGLSCISCDSVKSSLSGGMQSCLRPADRSLACSCVGQSVSPLPFSGVHLFNNYGFRTVIVNLKRNPELKEEKLHRHDEKTRTH